jgi:acetyl-CoA acetyltransferase family protein
MGGLSSVRADDLLAHSFSAVLEATGIDPAEIDDVFAGCANQAGEDNRNVARMALLLAGIPHSVPGVTLNRLCASGLEAVNQAFRAARCGDGDLFLVGGVESMSRAPYSMPRGPNMPKAGNVQIYDTCLGWRYPNPRMEAMFPLEAMGCTAENIVDQMGISREDQDAFALGSQEKAVAAQAAGAFDAEITPIEVVKGRRDTQVIATDEGPRPDSSMERLARLKPAFREGGTVTAGNSSTLNDGSAAMLVCTADKAKALGLKPVARLVACAAAGVDPTVMGLGPVPATKKALALAGWSLEDLDLIELNEAFAAQSLGVLRSLDLDATKVNVNGGAIALGHPLGCSGTRILTTLIHAMRCRGARRGLASLCVGVGQGVSTLVEAIDG